VKISSTTKEASYFHKREVEKTLPAFLFIYFLPSLGHLMTNELNGVSQKLLDNFALVLGAKSWKRG